MHFRHISEFSTDHLTEKWTEWQTWTGSKAWTASGPRIKMFKDSINSKSKSSWSCILEGIFYQVRKLECRKICDLSDNQLNLRHLVFHIFGLPQNC